MQGPVPQSLSALLTHLGKYSRSHDIQNIADPTPRKEPIQVPNPGAGDTSAQGWVD